MLDKSIIIACSFILLLPVSAIAKDKSSSELEELRGSRESAVKVFSSLKKLEKKARSSFKKPAKFLSATLQKAANLETAYKRNLERLEDTRKMPSGDSDTRAQKDAAIRGLERKKDSLRAELKKVKELSTKIYEQMLELNEAFSELVETRNKTTKDVIALAFEIVQMGRKPLCQLASSYSTSLNEGKLGTANESLKEKGAKVGRKTRVFAITADERWLLWDPTKRSGVAVEKQSAGLSITMKTSKDTRDKDINSEESKVNSLLRVTLANWDKTQAFSKQIEALLKAHTDFVERLDNL